MTPTARPLKEPKAGRGTNARNARWYLRYPHSIPRPALRRKIYSKKNWAGISSRIT
jgi:hypothetical protein